MAYIFALGVSLLPRPWPRRVSPSSSSLILVVRIERGVYIAYQFNQKQQQLEISLR